MIKTIMNILLIITAVVFYFLIDNITDILNIFLPITEIILTLLFFLIIYGAFWNKRILSLYSYFLFVFGFLFLRIKQETNVNFDFYLIDWLKLITKNQIVFINVFGNLLLFIPLVFYFNSKYNIPAILLFILFLETVQWITKRGIFDIVDIVLNCIGIFLGTIVKWRTYGQKCKRKQT